MKTLLIAGAIALASAAMSACAGFSVPGVTGGDPVALLNAVNQHLDGCDRHIQGTTGPVPSASFNIDCKAKVTPVLTAGAVAVPAAQPAR